MTRSRENRIEVEGVKNIVNGNLFAIAPVGAFIEFHGNRGIRLYVALGKHWLGCTV